MKELIMNYAQNNYIQLISIFIACVCLLYMYKRDNKYFVKQMVLKFVCLAEQQFGSKSGQAKFAMVYSSLPLWVRILFTQETLTKLINEAVAWIKVEIQGDKNLLSLADEMANKYLNSNISITVPEAEENTSKETTQANNTIPAITSIPIDVVPDVVINKEEIKVDQEQYCNTCLNGRISQGCKGCINQSNYVMIG